MVSTCVRFTRREQIAKYFIDMTHKEHKQGDVITLDNGVKLQVIAHEGCDKCYFSKHYPTACYGYCCAGPSRKDKTYINYLHINA